MLFTLHFNGIISIAEAWPEFTNCYSFNCLKFFGGIGIADSSKNEKMAILISDLVAG